MIYQIFFSPQVKHGIYEDGRRGEGANAHTRKTPQIVENETGANGPANPNPHPQVPKAQRKKHPRGSTANPE